MSTTHGQPGLSSDQRSTIRSTILSTRHTLEEELRRQLEKYGIYEDKKLSLNELTHLSAEELHTRDRIDAAIERELESTEGDLERSITNYVREATKTYLNRFVALKTIEVRGLVEETITERPEYGNRSYMHHTVAEIGGELTNSPDDGFGAALDLAYQEIGAEIRMIFEESEHTAIHLDAQVREEILDELDVIDDEAWESDEALGWVYQYFGEEERDEIDERVDKENYKIAGTDIATKTQLFTPRYIVEWLVDNSLGRLWLEMRGERTNIDSEGNCFYLAPLEDSLIDRETKTVEEITVLDPACGSGHMLFYAFDVLYQMYLEEGEIPEEYIPREILRNNLHGIDIDSGAVQIAALSLYLKAKEHSPDVEIPQLNVVSADAVLINGERKVEILDRTDSDLEKDILEQIWQSFDDIRELGSLVQVEDRIDELLNQYREELELGGQAQITNQGELTGQSTFVAGGEEHSWDTLREDLLEKTRKLARQGLEQNDPVEEMFANEVGKTVELLDLLVDEYDVVVSNPPYLSDRKMSDEVKEFLKSGYISHQNLYSAFIERNSKFLTGNGLSAMITPEGFMFQYDFRSLRPYLLENMAMLDTVHLSRYGFAQQKDVYTAAYVMRNQSEDSITDSRFFRMTHEQEEYDTYEKKVQKLPDLINTQRNKKSHPDVFVVDQSTFFDLPRTPFVYRFGDEILSAISQRESVEEVSEAVLEGLSTGNDDRFLRSWWEIDSEDIGSEERYRSIAMGGDPMEYFDSPEMVVDWGSSGKELRNFEGSHLRNEEYYGKEGIHFRKFGNYFTVRKHESGWFFTPTARLIKTSSTEADFTVMAMLCSSMNRYILNVLNPQIHFNISAVESVPAELSKDTQREVLDYAKRGMDNRKTQQSLKETKLEFDPDKFYDNIDSLIYKRERMESLVQIHHGKIDNEIFRDYELSEDTVEIVYDEVPKNLARLPIADINYTTDPDIDINSKQKIEDISSLIRSSDGEDLREISEDIDVSPISVAEIRHDEGLYDSEIQERWGGDIVSFVVGVMFGRWEINVEFDTLQDELLVFSSDNHLGKIRQALNRCEDRMSAQSLKTLLGKDPVEWFRNSFFRHHHCKEYRRRGQRIPIYWQLESPESAFSCYVYYHGIDESTLPKLRGQYIDPKIEKLENERDTLQAQTDGEDPDSELLDRLESVEEDLSDIREFGDMIDQMIDDGVTVDTERGIWENIKEWDQYEVLQTGLPKLKSSYSR
jgi:hypothetical protein